MSAPKSDERLVEDTLFLACTRPAMILGVTMEAMGLNVIFSSILFVLAGSLLYGLVALPIHFVCRLICRRDANQFPILFAWLETRGRHRNARLWGGSSCTPLRLLRRFSAKELPHG
ncbi:type IV secretion system protein VirB3 [Methylocystis rosea]|uniref:type IV secretion system protein VirB3 n=1 Tax=Methylocystis rosea TaxID=173366 RepID=UPI00036774D9|nr:type IV secretion system protein VirB3 [Methylocystis rosea]KAF0123054.1 MAG: type IV secretion system protein VirB3 [Methylocystaceae bacterium]KAF0212146.1 MAG: type IV secretion system protein [Methylocystaceae bacterium]TXT44062.1 MAG: type IV secretion system protein VirB3 [Methylocystaceae bacterium]